MPTLSFRAKSVSFRAKSVSFRAKSRNLHFLIFAALLTLATTSRAQSSDDRAREARERARERAREKAERDTERQRERSERERAASLDTVVAFDARGTVSVSCPGGNVIVTVSDKNEIRVRA